MWIDTHCHLDAHEFGGRPAALALAAQAQQRGVGMVVIPAVGRANFAEVRELAHQAPNACFGLGIHPIYVPNAVEDDLAFMREAVAEAMGDPRFVAIDLGIVGQLSQWLGTSPPQSPGLCVVHVVAADARRCGACSGWQHPSLLGGWPAAEPSP